MPDAIHFEYVETVASGPTAVARPKPCSVVFCGTPLGRPVWGALPWTRNVDEVTCKRCLERLLQQSREAPHAAP
jgi:hypothetical protein